ATYKNLWETITTGNSWRGVFCNKKKNGDLYWEQANISPIKDRDGNITHFLGYKEDITNHRRNEQRISTEHAITTILAEASSIAEASPKIFKAVCECLGWDYGEIWQVDRDAQLLRNIEIWHTPAINPLKFIELSKQLVLKKGNGIPGRVWKEGKPVWVADVARDANFIRKFIAGVEGLRGAIGFPIISNEECVGIMVFFNREIQPPDNELLTMLESIGRQIGQFIMRKRAETQLHKLSQAAEQSPSTIILTDTNGYIRYANLRFTQLTGYTLDEVIGETPSFLDSGITPREVYKRLWGTIASGEERDGEVISKKKTGEFYHERVHISSIKDEKGAITNFLITGEDITLLKAAEEEQKQLRSQLYHTQKLESIGQLAGGIAHDFNNIIMAIMGYANFLKLELGEDNPLSQYPVKLLAVAERAEKLTSGLLAFSRKQVFNLQTVSTNHIITSALSFLGMLIKSDIELKISLSENDCFIVADKNQIEQVLINLATNARDAMPKGGSLTIKTEGVELDNTFVDTYHYGKPGKYALISVTDTGMGMDEKTIKKIFEPFFTTKEVGKGTGLGLAIVYGIVKQHNGFINVYSEPGKGTTFKIYLPLSKIVPLSTSDSNPYNTLELPKQEISSGGKEEILVADDNEEIRDILKCSLEGNGYRTMVAVNGEDAIHKFTENKDTIRLLLFDVVMPKVNGMDAYLEIKKMRPGIKTIFMSGFNNDIINENILKNEDTYFISKPILPINLLEKVKKALN
ncbi:MAG: PAS domain S-box protein, partial [Planctomycetota bacterium]